MFNNDSFKVAKIMSALCSLSFLIANLKISYDVTLYALLIYEVSIGLFYPIYSKIKCEHLPSNSRGTLMNIFKIPYNIIVPILLLSMNKIFTSPQV